MKTSRHRSSRERRSFGQHVQATFGRLEPSRLRRRTLAALGIATLLMTSAASADWRVYDDNVERVLQDIRDNYIQRDGGSVTTHLKNLNDKLKVDQSANGQTPEMIPEPTGDEKLDQQNPTTSSGVDMAGRCPGGLTTAGIAAEQNKICQEMVRSELAMYRFSMRMFERAKENYDRLKEIEDQRRSIGENDYADLQDNSNKLLALTALMDNDRDRYRTYMSAYEARIEHLQKASDLLSRKAINGDSGGGGLLPTLAGAGALAVALRTAAKTDERNCTARMRDAGVC